nr:unnamed protein product [Callosobruchus chinensis]
MYPNELGMNRLWWKGPMFLLNEESDWPEIKQKSCNLPEVKEKSNTLFAFCAQRECFSQEISDLLSKNKISKKSKLLMLNPFLDENNVLRVGGRLENSMYSYDKKHPIILSSKHHLSKLIFEREHLKFYHIELQLRKKWTVHDDRKLEPGILVLIKQDGLPPMKWKLGRVISVSSDGEGVSRVARLKTDTDPFASSGSSYTPSKQTSESDSKATSDIPRRKRQRKANRALWKRSVVKSLRLSGQKYINRSGETQAKDVSKFPQCHEKISPLTKNRNTSRIYYLKDTKGARHRVCQKCFCATFAISHRVVETCVESLSDTRVFVGHDKRIHSKPHNATSAEVKQQVKKHTDLFPRIESHYFRGDSKKEYLSPELNISILYRLYIEFCEDLYLDLYIFHEYDPPLSFY